MKKILCVLLLLMLAMLTGCGIIGSGDTYGYITTVESGIFWDKVWMRAELESSETTCYVMEKHDSQLETTAKTFAQTKQRVKMTFNNHWFLATNACDGGEATEFTPIVEVEEIIIID